MRDRSFVALCALIVVNQIGFGLITPVLPSFARSFGLGAADIGLVIGIYGFARFIANVPAGQLSERLGRRPVLIAGTAITSVASLLMATSGNLPQLLAYRLLAGLGAATVLTGGQIMAGDLSTSENRGRMMSTYQGFFLFGVGVGPAPGGMLADAFGLRAPFVAYAIFSALACVVAFLVIRETRPERPPMPVSVAGEPVKPPPPPERIRATLLSRPFLLVGAVGFASFFARTGGIFTVVPLLGRESIGLSASHIGYAMTLITLLNLATVYPSGLLNDRFGRKVVIAPAEILSGVALVMFAFSGSLVPFFLSAALWGFSAGLAGPAPAAYVADLASTEVRGRAFGYFRTVADAGYIVGPLLLGVLLDRFGYATPLLFTAAMVATVGA
ncbi:MAG: MFS transporter, partial [Dehalococcoidia bacterium]